MQEQAATLPLPPNTQENFPMHTQAHWVSYAERHREKSSKKQKHSSVPTAKRINLLCVPAFVWKCVCEFVCKDSAVDGRGAHTADIYRVSGIYGGKDESNEKNEKEKPHRSLTTLAADALTLQYKKKNVRWTAHGTAWHGQYNDGQKLNDA